VLRRGVIRPIRWLLHKAKMGLHALLTWRKGEADEAS